MLGIFFLACQSTRTHWHPLIKINPTVNLLEERNFLVSLPWISPFWVSCGGINKRVGFNHFEGLDLYICPVLLSTKRVILAVATGRLEEVVMSLGMSGRWNLELCWIWPNGRWKVFQARGRCWARTGEAWSHLAQQRVGEEKVKAGLEPPESSFRQLEASEGFRGETMQ